MVDPELHTAQELICLCLSIAEHRRAVQPLLDAPLAHCSGNASRHEHQMGDALQKVMAEVKVACTYSPKLAESSNTGGLLGC